MKIGVSAIAVCGVMFALVGCSQVQLKKPTSSGHAEGVFHSTTAEEAKSKILSGCAVHGLVIEDSNGNQVICSKELQGMQAAMMQMTIGNSYSTTPQYKVRFVLISQANDVRVIAYPWAESTMPGGQVNKLEMNGNVQRNELQSFMNSVGAE
ncbi:hypothetical protein [Pseudomonas citronellolis]|uniref:hypothetical protein n=1 Tax=Pseudomonas citronellolis TaxID=53408 RepID=UPI0021C250A7|nr:hypothetical protein [Pseudomonas citronellolis]UXJ55053.1 hypothetical protein N5P21_12890 [Pseudomonas citronellolis]